MDFTFLLHRALSSKRRISLWTESSKDAGGPLLHHSFPQPVDLGVDPERKVKRRIAGEVFLNRPLSCIAKVMPSLRVLMPAPFSSHIFPSSPHLFNEPFPMRILANPNAVQLFLTTFILLSIFFVIIVIIIIIISFHYLWKFLLPVLHNALLTIPHQEPMSRSLQLPY